MEYLVGVLALIACSSLAFGQSVEIRRLAGALENIIAAEEDCELTFDQKAIKAIFERKMPADDISIVPSLPTVIQGSKQTLLSASTSAKTPHRAQVKRSAKNLWHYPLKRRV